MKIFTGLFLTLSIALLGCGGSGSNTSTTGGGGGGTTTFDPVPFAGAYAGNWNNTTFSSTGTATMAVTVDSVAGTLTVNIDLNGPVLGQGDPAPFEFTGTYDGTGFTDTITSAVFGDLSFEIDANGNFTGGSNNVPSPSINSVSFTGSISGNTATLNYTVTFSDSSTAVGTMTLTKS